MEFGELELRCTIHRSRTLISPNAVKNSTAQLYRHSAFEAKPATNQQADVSVPTSMVAVIVAIRDNLILFEAYPKGKHSNKIKQSSDA